MPASTAYRPGAHGRTLYGWYTFPTRRSHKGQPLHTRPLTTEPRLISRHAIPSLPTIARTTLNPAPSPHRQETSALLDAAQTLIIPIT